LLNGTGYNKFRIPEDDGMTIYVEIWIQAITSINELTNDFEMDIYITEKWLDPALNFENLSPCKGNTIEISSMVKRFTRQTITCSYSARTANLRAECNLSLNHQVLDRLWTPNSCFVNSKVAQIHDSPFRSVFLMLFPNGTVMVNYRVRVKGPCSLELSNFPLDLQTCGLIYERLNILRLEFRIPEKVDNVCCKLNTPKEHTNENNFNYNNQEVRMRWSNTDEPVRPMAPIVLPDFDLFKITANRKEELIPALSAISGGHVGRTACDDYVRTTVHLVFYAGIFTDVSYDFYQVAQLIRVMWAPNFPYHIHDHSFASFVTHMIRCAIQQPPYS
uniref:Neurotransmitter-gated ion-channel ligand binding domain protein n=1 Tax=Angiostrongylus cantonensis TaxID=6313 RepID=A0A0K0DRF6_ANGCA